MHREGRERREVKPGSSKAQRLHALREMLLGKGFKTPLAPRQSALPWPDYFHAVVGPFTSGLTHLTHLL
ncbi:hypothetical protein K0M31_009153 [Melipona bicolor]|uniref:Uncharacterized protein n=1 Tax=Melipona bicolor TaxID=60889 RepID=A0AA40KJM9_9HYME|nr:hypothetical protein K0M31_009153 [Melipona bicolor]